MTRAVLTVNAQGRVVIPAELRRELGIGPGSTLIATVQDRRLVLQDRDRLLAGIRAEIAAHVPAGVSLADELLAERSREVAREEATAMAGQPK